MAWSQQPRDVIPPINIDPDIRGAWLNAGLHQQPLGSDFSPAGDDMTPVAGPTRERVGCHFTAASLQYLRRPEAAWRGTDSFGVVSAWIKLDSVGVVHHIFTSADEGADADYWTFGINVANHLNITAVIGGVSRSVAGATALVADRWYRVSGMSDGGTWALYVDEDRETVTPAGAGNDGSWLSDIPDRDNVCIGALRTNTILVYFDGTIKDVRYRGLTVDVPDDVVREFRQSVPDPTLAYWNPGGNLDLTRFEHALTNFNGTIVGHQMEFNGTNQSIRSAALELTVGATVSLWFNADADEDAVLFNNVIHDARRFVVKTEAGGEMRAGYWQGAVYRAASGFGYEVNRWHHAYCTWDADETVRLWLDGIELTNAVDPSSGNGIHLMVGASSSGSGQFNGKIRDVRMWQADKGEAFGAMLYDRLRRSY